MQLQMNETNTEKLQLENMQPNSEKPIFNVALCDALNLDCLYGKGANILFGSNARRTLLVHTQQVNPEFSFTFLNTIR